MKHSILLAFARPVAGASIDEFESWYDEIHLPQILDRIPEIRAARRYRMSDTQFPGAPSDFSHVTMYEMRREDAARVRTALADLFRSRSLDLSPTADVKGSISWFLDEVSSHIPTG